MNKILHGYIAALIFWFIMFSPWTAHLINFWVMMLISTGALITYSYILRDNEFKDIYKITPRFIFIGIIAAAALYLVFFAGNFFSNLLFDFSRHQVSNIYSTKEQASKYLIGAALLLWIGPAEEIFWRGFAQHNLEKWYGPKKAFIINSIVYAFVHIWAFNFMLFMAALICGLFWGWMYMKYHSVIPINLSCHLGFIYIYYYSDKLS